MMELMPFKRSKLKIKSYFLCFTLSLVTLNFACCMLHLQPVLAATMTNPSYTIDNQDVQIQPFNNESPKPQIRTQTQKALASGDNYTVTTSNPDAFSFSISQDSLSFGKLQATNPV